jgi:hypothetical protein
MITAGMDGELRWYDLEGELTRIYRLPLEAQRVTNRIKQGWLDELMETMREYMERSGAEPPSVRDQVFPEYIPLWNSARLDDAGFLWLFAVHVPGVEEKPEGWSCHVLDPEGCWLGRMVLPGTSLSIRFGHVVSTIRDPESGVEITTLYRLRPEPRGLDYPASGG